MNNKFSISRLLMLIKRELTSGRRSLTMEVLMMLAIMLVIVFLVTLEEYRYEYCQEGDCMWEDLIYIYLWLMALMGCISASLMMDGITTQRKRVVTLMIPATSLEKYLSQFIIYTIGFVVVYALCFFVTETLRWMVFESFSKGNIRPLYLGFFTGFEFTTIYRHWEFVWIEGQTIVLCMVLFLQSALTLGSVIWPRRTIVHTAVALFIMGIIVSVVSSLTEMLISSNYEEVGYIAVRGVSSDAILWTFVIASLVLTLFNWTMTYYRLKETDVINTKI